ncbi:MAG: type ISP restriction/modification enzyme [Pyrinomonadaceae bacterium]
MKPLADPIKRKARIYYARVDEFWRKEEKYAYLDETQHRGNVEWQEVQPDAKHNWLTAGMQDEFASFIPMGTKEAKTDSKAVKTIFKNYGRGVATTRDAWVYNFNENELVENVARTIDAYNAESHKWSRLSGENAALDSFINNNNKDVSWSEGLKNSLRRGVSAEFQASEVRVSLYRPFSKTHLYFDAHFNERRYQMPATFPTAATELENVATCVSDRGRRSPFSVLTTNIIPDLHLCASSDLFQGIPFYTYNEDGENRRENITDWALDQFRGHYKDKSITKWDIFHYVYAVLHHRLYRERYAANLKRELPRIPFTPDFKAFAYIGNRLAEIHVNYEQQPEYPLEKIETPGTPLDWRVERMKLSKDPTATCVWLDLKTTRQ